MAKSLDEVVEELLGIVRSRPPHVYWHGLPQSGRLYAHPDAAIDRLIPALGEPNPEVRQYVARLIRGLNRGRAARLLAPLLSDAEEDVRLEAAGAVLEQPGWYGRDPATPPPELDDPTQRALVAALLPLLASRKRYVVERAITLFEMSGSAEHIPVLLASLPEPDWNHRSLVFGALGRAPNAVALLTPLIDHADAATRGDALLTLSFSRVLALGPELARAIVTHLDDTDEHVRHAAALCAGRLAILEAEPKLIELVASAPDDRPKSGLIVALGLLRSERAIPVLLTQLAPTNPSQRDAIQVLARFAPRVEIEDALLVILTSDPDIHSRNEAANALAEIGTANSIAPLEHFLQKDVRRLTKRLRKAALRSLPAAIQRLRRLYA